MQNQKIILGIGAAVIILLGGLLLMPKKNTPSTSNTAINPTNSQSNSGTTKNTLSGLLSLGKTVECTFDYDENNSQVKGTVYVSGNKMRGDFIVDVLGQTQNSSTIQDGDVMYVWGSSMPQGIKMDITDEQKELTQDAQKYYDRNKQIDYKCKPWVAKANLFTPPANITFTDVSESMKNIPTLSKDMKASQCQACDSLTGESKAMCLKQLNCN